MRDDRAALDPLAYLGLARSLGRSHGPEPLEVEGRLPDGLSGVLYRNGPGLFDDVAGTRYGHIFDGDGAVSRVRFADGRAEGAVRVVETAGLRRERARGRARYGGYGTRSKRPFWDTFFGSPKNAANTSVMRRGEHLLALWEAGPPTALDPETLETVGVVDLGGAITGPFSAHPHRVPSRRCSYNFGIRRGRLCTLDLYALPDDGPARRLATLPVANSLVHDFIATENHLVFFIPPLRLDVAALALGRAPFDQALAWRPEEGTEVLVVPIDDPSQARRFTAEPFYQWHFANASEQGGEIRVDFVRYPDFETNAWLRRLYAGESVEPTRCTYDRAVITGDRLQREVLLDRSTEFPVVAPGREAQAQRFAYMVQHHGRDTSAAGPHEALVRFDHHTGETQVYDPGPGHFPSEPVFAPRPDGAAEDDGWLLSLNYAADRDRSYVEVLDARALGDGPLARVWFDQALPQTFHGRWYPDPEI